MTNVDHALRSVSDELLADLDRLQELEETKRSVRPDDPQLVGLAREVEQIASRVLGSSRDQAQIAETASSLAEVGHPAAPKQSIEDTPRDIRVILADWREAERKAALGPTSPDAATARASIAALRSEYRRAFEAARRQHDASASPTGEVPEEGQA